MRLPCHLATAWLLGGLLCTLRMPITLASPCMCSWQPCMPLAGSLPQSSLGMRRLYELDGRKSFAVDHGPTSPSTFLQVGTTTLVLHAAVLDKLCLQAVQWGPHVP